AISERYFAALAARDVSDVPWHPDVELRGPLCPQGSEAPIVGRNAVVEWFTSIYPVLGPTTVLEHYFHPGLTSIATRADVTITEPPCVLRVIDRFRIDSEGLILEQENHYDPRAAIPGSGEDA
ncbi:MAG TPA: nuclear transport factor 2 family protein, partial [Longimicrobiales bacterium]|nr:nuclear transport factor 2 family protein [Longimicrobiales bacterium]